MQTFNATVRNSKHGKELFFINQNLYGWWIEGYSFSDGDYFDTTKAYYRKTNPVEKSDSIAAVSRYNSIQNRFYDNSKAKVGARLTPSRNIPYIGK